MEAVALLTQLETQLGLPQPRFSPAQRVSEFARALTEAPRASFTQSLEADRWGTATALLARWDELRLAGWDGRECEGLPALARDMARAVAASPLDLPGEAERLDGALAALDAGQVWAGEPIALPYPLAFFPALWQRVLKRLPVTEPEPACPLGATGTTLCALQNEVLEGARSGQALAADASFRYVRSRTRLVAAESVASILGSDRTTLAETTVLCEDVGLASLLDAALARRDVPTMGVSRASLNHPVLAVLPLAMELQRLHGDPQKLYEFLTLPVCPIPRKAARELVQALMEAPGKGSVAWEKAMERILTADPIPDHELRTRIRQWIGWDHPLQNGRVPIYAVTETMEKVVDWAQSRGAGMRAGEAEDATLANALERLAASARLLGSLAESFGEDLSEPQLQRLMESALEGGIVEQPYLEAASGPVWVRSLEEITEPTRCLLWLGVQAENPAIAPWPRRQIDQFRALGINVDDGSAAVQRRRYLERRGFSMVTESVLVVYVATSEERRDHPLWVGLRTALEQSGADTSLGAQWLEDALTAGDDTDSGGRGNFQTETMRHEMCSWAPPPKVWRLDAPIPTRDTVSAASLETQLACPLKWTFQYAAGLRSGWLQGLPGERQYQGSFAHVVLNAVFGGQETPPTHGTIAQRVEWVFNDMLPRDAAPLANPSRTLEARRLRDQLVEAATQLAGALDRGGYTVSGLEVQTEGDYQGRALNSRIDCLARAEDGAEIVIDFKLGGDTKHREALQDGRATQLATYAFSRKLAGGQFPAVAYLILESGLFLTPTGSPMRGGATPIEGPSIAEVWERFDEALTNASAWMGSGQIPVRPRHTPDQWPDGTTLVLEEKPKPNEGPTACRYCDFGTLCGQKEVQ